MTNSDPLHSLQRRNKDGLSKPDVLGVGLEPHSFHTDVNRNSMTAMSQKQP